MGTPVGGTLLIHSDNQALIKRLPHYFDSKTRPDFAEDVPENEAQWIDVFEVIEDPDRIKPIDDYHLAVSFNPDESDYSNEMQDLCEALVETVGVKQVIYYQYSDYGAEMYRLNFDGIVGFAWDDEGEWNIKAVSDKTAELIEENAYAEGDELFDLLLMISKELVGVVIPSYRDEDDE
ncbi:hypothetical protein [uncultured Cocleimonas sp.]|uniref:hypothetical protein n=1 Tax=uncultured Cocleimonas sp. TaxID=1051587 RepID=UPI0026202C24|nr:hypothetical protein [uncultured Cocleimonas sp.]